MPPFVIFSLPRSRSFWLSRFLSCGDWMCGHDEASRVRSLDDVRTWLRQESVGSVETSSAGLWRMLPLINPEVRIATLRRPYAEVADSLARLGVVVDSAVLHQLRRAAAKLDQIEARLGCPRFEFDELGTWEGAARVLAWATGTENPAWCAAMVPMNLQSDLRETLRRCHIFRAQHDKAAAMCRRWTVARMGPRKVVSRDDVTIQQETCDDWFRDGTRLFEEHSLELGEPPDGFLRKNWPVMRAMDQMGCMQIMTARCNGRMVGYYVCYIAPATDDIAIGLSALHISVFVSPDFKGIAPRLQRASIEALRHRGVGEICFRAGVKADGERMGAMYRRVGAEPMGQIYRLQLKAA